MTEPEMVAKVGEWIDACSADQQDAFDECPRWSLIAYHNGLGRRIRNDFGLWKVPWEPEIDKRGVDVSDRHPDAISMRVIRAVWDARQKASESVVISDSALREVEEFAKTLDLSVLVGGSGTSLLQV